ncbi:MAG: type VI secretion system ImpA family N-terminal domain-containing protein [Nibricoccus sp.]
MSVLMIEHIKDAVEGALPAGCDFSVSGELLELETMARPVHATNSDGKRVADDESEREPDWGALEQRSLELLARSRDLRIAVFSAAAALRTRGFEGLAEGLRAIKQLLVTDAYNAYPQLDSTDSIVERWNTIAALAAPYKRDGDLLRVIEGIRHYALVRSSGGSLCYRDVLVARNRSGGADVAAVERMRSEWKSLAAGERTAISRSLTTAYIIACDIEKIITEQTPETITPGNGSRPLQLLIQELRGLIEFTGEAPPKQQAEKEEVKLDKNISMHDGIHSRSDAIRVLREVAEYFRKTEPASPVPYFLERAVRLVDCDFLGLLAELAPESVAGFQNVAGVGKQNTTND